MMSPPSPPIAAADRAAFLAVVQASGLLSPAQSARAAAALPPAAVTAAQAAQFFVQTGQLTPFQAERLLAGRADGLLLGQYVIQEPVGKGAMGRVYKAKHRTMNRPVAIKVLAPELTRTPQARAAFAREVRAAARLGHPNIVTAYDANEVGERAYLVLEFVDGPNLDALVRRGGPLPPAIACEVVRQAALGFQHAHDCGMVHRDVKPANLLLARPPKAAAGVVKIADFGVARLTADPAGRPPGGQVGTPDYAAPEQTADPSTADHRADLYSLGCVFYFLLTGRPPFPGGTAAEKAYRHQWEEPVRVDRLRADVPAAAAAVVHALLAKDPAARPATAAEVAARLEALAAGAAGIPAGDPGGHVSFDLPAAPHGQASGTAGSLTGGHSPAPVTGTHPPPGADADTSPWFHLTDEALTTTPAPVATLGGVPAVAPVAPPAADTPHRPGVSVVTMAALGATVVIGLIVLLGVMIRHFAK